MIHYGHQSIDESDISAVVEVLRGEHLTRGPAVEEFEQALCARTGARFAVAVANGTAALHAACWAARLGPGDTVATSALTFSASAGAAVYVGATPALLDIDPATLNLDLQYLPEDVDALVAVHYAGLPIDLTRLNPRPRVVIEDAAHALGASTPLGPIGNCASSDLCCFSFHPVKPITTAEGGAVTTNDPELAERLRRFRHHGIVAKPDEGPWAYEIPELGYNYRLTDVQAALGTSQLRRLDEFISRRNALAARYRAELADLPVVPPPAAPNGTVHGYHLFAIRVPADRRRAIVEALHRADVGVQVHYVPLHHHPPYAAAAQYPAGLPETDAAYAGLVSLPIHPALGEADQTRVIELLRELLR